MDICIRSCLTSSLVVVGVSALIVAPVASPRPTAPSAPPPVALTAQVQPLRQLSAQALPTRPTTSAAMQPLNPLTQQVSFHIAFIADFLSTGAVLFGREFKIPGALLQDVQHGTPVPVAVGRALQTFAQIEIEAGRDLVGFAVQYVSFQLNFVANLMTMPVAAVGGFAGSLLAGVTPASATAASLAPGRTHAPMTAVTPATITAAGPSGHGTLQRVDASQASSSSTHTVTLQPKRSRSVVPESGRSGVTHKPATGASEMTSSTGGAGQADAGSRQQSHHEHDGHPKGGGNQGD